jgi:hypothetical protein
VQLPERSTTDADAHHQTLTHLRVRTMLVPSLAIAPGVSCGCAGRSLTTTFTRSATEQSTRTQARYADDFSRACCSKQRQGVPT